MSKKLRKYLSLAPRFLASVTGKAGVVGYVEHLEPTSIHGWAINRKGKPIQFVLSVDGQHFPLAATWNDRTDVAGQHGPQYIQSGFRSTPSADASAALKKALRQGLPIKVLAGRVALGMVAKLPALAVQLSTEKLGVKTDKPGLKGEIENWGNFTLRGWAAVNECASKSITLIRNGETLDCVVIPGNRQDIARQLGIPANRIGFELELPGYLWESLPETEEARIEIHAEGHPLTSEPIVLNRKKAVRWIADIARMEEGEEKQYRMLCALEHVRYGGMLPLLDEASRQLVLDFTRRMNLEDFLMAAPVKELPTRSQYREDGTTLLHWRALRQLNTRLVMEDGDVFAHVKAVHDGNRLAGETRGRYIHSVIPLLCRCDQLHRLRELVRFSSLHYLERSNNDWELSLAVPILVADGLVARATDILGRLTKTEKRVWLNTECLRFAVEGVQRQEAAGEIAIDVAEKFRTAFIGVLNAFQGKWFSRLHDRELIDGMLLLLRDLDNYTNYHRRDVMRAAMRHYGLCRDFWQRLDAQAISVEGEDFQGARAAWNILSGTLESREKPLAEGVGALREPLALFHRAGNPEAIFVLREVLANSLPHLNSGFSIADKELIAWLMTTVPAEGVRLAAFPLSQENRLLDSFPEGGGPRLLQTLRQLTTNGEHPVSTVYDLQLSAAQAMQQAKDAFASRDTDALAAALAVLDKRAILLAGGPGMFIGADFLASAYALARAAGLDADPFASRWAALVRRALEEGEGDGMLPVPVQTSLSRLGEISGDVMLDGLLAELRREIEARFGAKHAPLFSRVAAPTLAVDILGWPQDTLVVVYSCRKYLDTRIQAVRETWVQDLKARGIPYLILVGDGDDTIEGDVLALNVSDKYEDLPKKTLALFRWVIRCTNFQYVLKIDDDCYLDVARYFDTLSYRKRLYYGRLIRRAVGSMDRAWHQPKSHTAHAQKTLDKSPEPSTYADGGGGYALSRLAMAKLQEMAESHDGQRLIACSLMEDKLVGDLLALAHIKPSNEDYESYQRRRTFGDALPVGMWENTFFPARHTPTKVVHLDTEKDMANVRTMSKSAELWPKKLWPTDSAPQLYVNQLELLSDALCMHGLLSEPVVVVSVIRNEITLLPHFLAHYRRLGVRCFMMVDNLSDDGSREYLLGQPDVVLFSTDTAYKQSHFGVAWQQAVLGNLCLGKWVVLADADEFLVYPDCEGRPLMDFIRQVEAQGFDAVRTDMVDMYPFGNLEDADFSHTSPFDTAGWFDAAPLSAWRLGSGQFSNSASFGSALRHRLQPDAEPEAFVSQKYALFRYMPWLRFSDGLHYAANLNAHPEPVWFAHFKYHAGFKDKIRIEIRRGQHFNNAAEYRRYADMLAEGKGGFGKEGVSIRYEGSASFSSAMPGGGGKQVRAR